LEALKEKTAGSLLRYPTCPKWVTFALAKSLNFDGGKIKESRHYFDLLSFMQQLGLLPQ